MGISETDVTVSLSPTPTTLNAVQPFFFFQNKAIYVVQTCENVFSKINTNIIVLSLLYVCCGKQKAIKIKARMKFIKTDTSIH